MENLKNNYYLFGSKIAKYRKDKHLTQEELAEKFNVTSQSISKWENGKCFPRLKIIIKICDELEINYNDFFRLLFE